MTPTGDSSALFNTSAFSNSEMNMDLNKSANSSMNNPNNMMHDMGSVQIMANAQQLNDQLKQQHKVNMMVHMQNDGHMQLKNAGDDSKQIDDLVREFREYSNEFTIVNSRIQPQLSVKPHQPQQMMQPNQVNYMAPNQVYALNQAQIQQTSNSTSVVFSQIKNPINKPMSHAMSMLQSDLLKQHQQQMHNPPDPLFNPANPNIYTMTQMNAQQQQQNLMQRQNQMQLQQQQRNIVSQQSTNQTFDGYLHLQQNIDYSQNMQHMQNTQQPPKMAAYQMADSLINDQQQQHTAETNLFNPMATNDIEDHQDSWMNANPVVQQDPRFFNQPIQLKPPAVQNTNMTNPGSSGTAGLAASQTQVDDSTKQAKAIEKFQMDEEMGEYATQAMVLYSNKNFPNLKQEYPDRNERYKHVQKLWRKLDATSKQNYVNIARQNRSKKRCDDKQPSIRLSRQTKSPCNSDKMSFSDAENLSRAETPSIAGALESNFEESLSSGLNVTATNQSHFIRLKSIDTVGQTDPTVNTNEHVQIHIENKHDTQQQIHDQLIRQQRLQAPNAQQSSGTVINQFRFQTPAKSSPVKLAQQINSPNQTQSNLMTRHPQQQQQVLLYQLQQHPNEQQLQQRTPKHIDMEPNDLYSMAQQAPRPPIQAHQHEYMTQQQPTEVQHQNSPSNPLYVYDQFAMPSRQLQQLQQDATNQQHDNTYQQQQQQPNIAPKTPSHVNTPLGSPHPEHTNLHQYNKKASPFSRPPSTPHSEHSSQLIDTSPYMTVQRTNIENYDQVQQQQQQQQKLQQSQILMTSPRMQRPLSIPNLSNQQQTLSQSPQNNTNQINMSYNYNQQNLPANAIIQSPQQQAQQQIMFHQNLSPLNQYQQNPQIIAIQSPQHSQQQQANNTQHLGQQQRLYVQQSPTTITQLPQSPINQGARQIFPQNSPVINFQDNQILIQQASPRMRQPNSANQRLGNALLSTTANQQQQQQVMFNLEQGNFQLLSPQQNTLAQQNQAPIPTQIVYQNQMQHQQQNHSLTMLNIQPQQQQPNQSQKSQLKLDSTEASQDAKSDLPEPVDSKSFDQDENQLTVNQPLTSLDYVDQLIADVAAGAGTIPYLPSDEFNESENSQMSNPNNEVSSLTYSMNNNIATEISETTLQRANIMLLQLPADDFQQQQQQAYQDGSVGGNSGLSISKFPPSNDPAALKIYKILADAKQEEQIQQNLSPSSLRAIVKPQQQQQQQQAYNPQIFLQHPQQQQTRHPLVMKPVITSTQQHQQQQQYLQQIRSAPSNQPHQLTKPETNLSNEQNFANQHHTQWTSNKQGQQTIAQIQQSDMQLKQQQQAAKFISIPFNVEQPQPQFRGATIEEMHKDISDKILAVEKEISSFRRKRTELNKKNKLILSKIQTSNDAHPEGTVVVAEITELNEQQRLKHAANQLELDNINKSIENLLKKCNDFKGEQKVLQQKMDQNQKLEQEHEQRLNETSSKMMNTTGRLSKENQKDYDSYINQRIQPQGMINQNRPMYDPGMADTQQQPQYSSPNANQLIQINPSLLNQNQAIMSLQKPDAQSAYIIMTTQATTATSAGVSYTTSTGQINTKQTLNSYQIIDQLSSPTNATKTRKPKQQTQKKKSIKDIASESDTNNDPSMSAIMSLDFKIEPKPMASSPPPSMHLQQARLIKPPQIQQINIQQAQKPFISSQQQQIFINPKPLQTGVLSGSNNNFTIQQQMTTQPHPQQQQQQHHPISVQLMQRTNMPNFSKTQFLSRPSDDRLLQQQHGDGNNKQVPSVCQDENLRKMLLSTNTLFHTDASSLLNTNDDLGSFRSISNAEISSHLEDGNINETVRQSASELLEHMQLDGTVDQFLSDEPDLKKPDEQQALNNDVASSSTSPSTTMRMPMYMTQTQNSNHDNQVFLSGNNNKLLRNPNEIQVKLNATAFPQQQQSVILNHELLANYNVSVQQQQLHRHQQQQHQSPISFPLYTTNNSPHKFIIQQPHGQSTSATTQNTATFILNNPTQQQQTHNPNEMNFQQYIAINNLQAYPFPKPVQQQQQTLQLINPYQSPTNDTNMVQSFPTLAQVEMATKQKASNEFKKQNHPNASSNGSHNQVFMEQQPNDLAKFSEQIPVTATTPTNQIPPSSNLNSDNTLLKQLLQTAPRNASDQLKVSNQQFVPHNSIQQATVQATLKQEPNVPPIMQQPQQLHIQQHPSITQTESELNCNGHRPHIESNDNKLPLKQEKEQEQAQPTTQKVVKKRARKPKQSDDQIQQQQRNDEYEKRMMHISNTMEHYDQQLLQLQQQQQQQLNSKIEPISVTVQKKPRKRNCATNSATHTPNKKDSINELELNEMLDKLKRLPQIELSQPTVNTSDLSISYPGKFKQKNSNSVIQKYKYGNFSVDSILSSSKDASIKSKPEAENALNLPKLEVNKENEKTQMIRYFDKRFKVCNALVDNTNEMQVHLKANTIMDSSKRIKYLIDNDYSLKQPPSPSSDTVMSASSIDDELSYDENLLKSLYKHQSLKYYLADSKLQQNSLNHTFPTKTEQAPEPTSSSSPSPSSAAIPIDNKHVDHAASPVFDCDMNLNANNIYSIKEEALYNHMDQQTKTEKVSVTLTLSKEQANDIRSVLASIAQLLPINLPSTWDMGLVTTALPHKPSPTMQNADNITNNINSCLNNIKQQLQQQQLHASSLFKLNRETGFNINTLIGSNCIKTCKFCDSILLEEHEFLVRKQEDIGKLVNYSQLKSKLSASASSTDVSLFFCTEACLNSYARLLNLQYKQRLLMESFQLAVNNMDSQMGSNDQQAGVSSTASCSSPHYADMFSADDSECEKKNKHKRKLTDSMTKQLPPEKRWKGLRWRKFDPTVALKTIKLPSTKEIDDLIVRLDANVSVKNIADKRVCCFCQLSGDQDTKGTGRLLMLDISSWSHLNCALWSNEVYETMNGALINVDVAFKRSLNCDCYACRRKGASLKCFSPKCNNYYHVTCAIKEKCVFYQDKVSRHSFIQIDPNPKFNVSSSKTFYCASHAQKTAEYNVVLTDLAVHRKVWIQRNEVAQIQRSVQLLIGVSAPSALHFFFSQVS
jgi:hypothetical protein